MIYSKARDGSPICSCRRGDNDVLLHSAYNPIREAERFVAALDTPFVPDFVVITEPALSYTAQFLRQRFPKAKIFAVRYCGDFAGSDALWDGVFYADAGGASNGKDTNDALPLKTALYNALGEVGLFCAFFCAWPPSARAFPDEDAAAWCGIREAVTLGRDILATRTKNASRWVLNAFSLAVRMNNAAMVQKGTAPIVVAASGASLMSSLPLLKKRRHEYFLIALSSALSPLRHAGLECDLCLTTDGGFYAASHLSPYSRHSSLQSDGVWFDSVVCTTHQPRGALAVAAEGNCSADVLEKAAIVPLVYPDGPASCVVRLCVPQAMAAERNGTVSGTALRLAQSLTAGNIYFCGLDLCGGAGRQHCPPNELEVSQAAHDNRLCTADGRATASRFASSALEIYRQWFAALGKDEVSRVFRLSSGGTLSTVYDYGNTLGNIQDVDFDHFYKCLDATDCDGRAAQLPRIVPCPLHERDRRVGIARDFVDREGNTHKWFSEIFPVDCISIEHTSDSAEKERRKAALQEKNDMLVKKIRRILDAAQCHAPNTANEASHD